MQDYSRKPVFTICTGCQKVVAILLARGRTAVFCAHTFSNWSILLSKGTLLLDDSNNGKTKVLTILSVLAKGLLWWNVYAPSNICSVQRSSTYLHFPPSERKIVEPFNLCGLKDINDETKNGRQDASWTFVCKPLDDLLFTAKGRLIFWFLIFFCEIKNQHHFL